MLKSNEQRIAEMHKRAAMIEMQKLSFIMYVQAWLQLLPCSLLYLSFRVFRVSPERVQLTDLRMLWLEVFSLTGMHLTT